MSQKIEKEWGRNKEAKKRRKLNNSKTHSKMSVINFYKVFQFENKDRYRVCR